MKKIGGVGYIILKEFIEIKNILIGKESIMIMKFKDGGLLKITHENASGNADTDCYSSDAIDEIRLMTTDYIYSVDKEEYFSFNVGSIMKFFLDNVEEFKTLTQIDFLFLMDAVWNHHIISDEEDISWTMDFRKENDSPYRFCRLHKASLEDTNLSQDYVIQKMYEYSKL